MTEIATGPGRSCPLHYRYPPSVFATCAPPAMAGLEVLYVVGGLYGNAQALERVLELFDAERGRKRLVFNGDFHWFDAEPALFTQVQQGVLAHAALRCNVETELAAARAGDDGPDAGCGCAYPAWVGDAVVERSNRILQRLRGAVSDAQRAELGRLPMWLRADVGPLALGLVHGDAQSLAGWGFAQELLREPAHRAGVRGWFEQAGVDAFACSHTCLPVFQPIGAAPRARPWWVFNNGAAGMPNFGGDPAGLLTRVALAPFRGSPRRFGVRVAGVHVDAIAIAFDSDAWQREFLRLWPPGSDAHESYASRIAAGPAYRVDEALRDAP